MPGPDDQSSASEYSPMRKTLLAETYFLQKQLYRLRTHASRVITLP